LPLFPDNDLANKLLTLGLGMMSASGPSKTPVDLGQVLGQGFQTMNEWENDQTESAYRKAQSAELESKKTERERLLERQRLQRQQLERLLSQGQGGTPGTPGTPVPSAVASDIFGQHGEMTAPAGRAADAYRATQPTQTQDPLSGMPESLKQALLVQAQTDPEGALKSYNDWYQQQYKAPAGYRYRADMSLEAIPGGPATKPENQPEFVDLMNAYSDVVTQEGADSPRAKLLRDRLNKLSTRDSGTTVNLPPTESGYSKKTGEHLAEMMKDIQDAGFKSTGQTNSLKALEQSLSQVATGKLTPLRTRYNEYAKSLGLPEWGDDVSQAQFAQATSRELALQLRNPAGGAGMPGALSDKDREFLESMVPSIEMTPGGWHLLIDYRKRMNTRNQEVAKLARDYQKKNGILDYEFQDELAAWGEAHPLFTESDRRQAQGLAGVTGSAGAGNPPQASPGDLTTLDDSAFLSLDLSTLSPEQRKAYADELTRRGY
jgi:hypothetical protein